MHMVWRQWLSVCHLSRRDHALIASLQRLVKRMDRHSLTRALNRWRIASGVHKNDQLALSLADQARVMGIRVWQNTMVVWERARLTKAWGKWSGHSQSHMLAKLSIDRVIRMMNRRSLNVAWHTWAVNMVHMRNGQSMATTHLAHKTTLMTKAFQAYVQHAKFKALRKWAVFAHKSSIAEISTGLQATSAVLFAQATRRFTHRKLAGAWRAW